MKKYKRKINYKWYKNFADNHEVLVRISKKNLIKLESPFFKKLKSYKKFKYLVTPKKYKNIFKNFHFKNIIWRKSFLLNKKFRKHELASKKQVIKEYNWKKTRKEPWHTKRAKWLSWTLHPKHKSSPFFIGTHVWNNRWNDYFKQNILQKINKNKHIPTQAYISEVRPFIRHLIFQQKHLPTNYIHNNYKLLYLVVQDIAKTYWTDKIFNPDNSEEIIWGFENLSEKDTEDDLPEIIAAEADPLIFFDEIEPFFSELFHDIKKSSFILYKNWPRQIFQDTILLKNIHKRMKVIENSSRKERLEYKDPQPRFDKFHRLFSIDWRIKRAAPWFEPLFFPRILHPVQYFNFWYSKKSIYIRKRSKIYRKFSKEAFNLYEPIKYRSYRRGGHRNFNWNRILSKVLMPFFGKTFSQFQSSFNELRTKKSKQIGRTNAFIKNLNSQLYRLIYNFNSAPSIFWARKIVEIGWVYVSHLKIQNNTKAIFNSISIDNLFPLLSINKNYAYSSNKLAKFTQLPIRAQSNKVNNGATVSINPLIKLLIKEFFSRRLAWDRRVTPSYGILNRKKTVMIISQQRYKDNFSEYTKDRSNTKRFPFFYN